MQKRTCGSAKMGSKKRDDLLLWIPALFGFGIAFYLSYQENFLTNFSIFSALLCGAVLIFLLNCNSPRSLILAGCIAFLLGGFYANYYEKIFLNHTKISGKIYGDIVGKIESIKKFYNPVNNVEGVNLIISAPEIYEAKFREKEKPKEPETKKKKKISHKKTRSRSITTRKIEKDFVNLEDYQDIDRKFLDFSKNYQQIEWATIGDRNRFPNPPQKISVNLIKDFSTISVNDEVAFRALLQPAQSKEFPDDFDYSLDAKMKKIGAYGFVIGEATILKKAAVSNIDEWFLSLREKIRQKILQNLSDHKDQAAISLALLIGDQTYVSKELMEKIRNCGLAHLLSISGFHLSLAGAIFFIITRFLLSRSEYLALNFDLKKIASIAAIIATSFYLKIADSPLPAQRSFLMIFFALIALFLNEKINPKRVIMSALLILILLNPYIVFNVSFQLSFAAILVMGIFYQDFSHDFIPRFLRYPFDIILLSLLIQIATLPILMHSFQSLALLGLTSNVIAIPLTSFIIMPFGFLSLLFMPLGLEKYALLAMKAGILLLIKVITFFSSFNYSHLSNPGLPSIGLAIAILGLVTFCLLKSSWRFIGIPIFLLSFTSIFFEKKPDLIFEKHQKFFATYDKNEGLAFSKNFRRSSKQIRHWMYRFGERKFKTIQNCEKTKCVIEKSGKKILLLLERNKISEICKNNFDVIVNLTAKYQLPQCIGKDKITIDNFDFLDGKTQFLFLKNYKFYTQKIDAGGKAKRDNK